MRTAEGRITVQAPQVRDGPGTYRSKLMGFWLRHVCDLRGNTDVLERLAIEMYARGLSTRDIEEALEEATGDRLSKMGRSRVRSMVNRLISNSRALISSSRTSSWWRSRTSMASGKKG